MATDRKSKNTMKQPAPDNKAFPMVRMTPQDSDTLDRTKIGQQSGNVPAIELTTIEHDKDHKTVSSNLADMNRATAPPFRTANVKTPTDLGDAMRKLGTGGPKDNRR